MRAASPVSRNAWQRHPPKSASRRSRLRQGSGIRSVPRKCWNRGDRSRVRDIDIGLDKLRAVLACADRAPEDTCEAVLDALLPARPKGDVALLVARPHALGPERVAEWEWPRDPAIVSGCRAAVTEQPAARGLDGLAAWGLDELAFTTELIAGGLVTDAIRHVSGPVRLRLPCDRAPIREVSDGSSTSPRLRRARSTDEGGRGLLLVAQLNRALGNPLHHGRRGHLDRTAPAVTEAMASGPAGSRSPASVRVAAGRCPAMVRPDKSAGQDGFGGSMRLRVEFTTEPFDLDEAPAHALVARQVIETAELDAVDVGPFGNTAEGGADSVLTAVDALLRKTLEAGATRVSLQVNVIEESDR